MRALHLHGKRWAGAPVQAIVAAAGAEGIAAGLEPGVIGGGRVTKTSGL